MTALRTRFNAFAARYEVAWELVMAALAIGDPGPNSMGSYYRDDKTWTGDSQ